MPKNTYKTYSEGLVAMVTEIMMEQPGVVSSLSMGGIIDMLEKEGKTGQLYKWLIELRESRKAIYNVQVALASVRTDRGDAYAPLYR